MLADVGLAELAGASGSEVVRIEEAALRALQQQAAVLAARDKALSLLSHAPATEYLLRLKLRERGHGTEAVEAAVAWLVDRGLLDDRRFAEAWLASRLQRRPEGRGALLAGLRRRGVPREVAEQAVLGGFDAEVEREAAQRLLAKLRRQGASEPEELARRLAAKGFPRSLVRELLEQEG